MKQTTPSTSLAINVRNRQLAKLTLAMLASALIVVSNLQPTDSATADTLPTCATSWFKNVNESNDPAGVLVCDHTVNSASSVDFALNLPTGVSQVYVVAIGGGGGGGAGGVQEGLFAAGGGGGAGEVILNGLITGLSPTSSVTYTVGTGGIGGNLPADSQPNGGSSGTSSTVKVGEEIIVEARGGQGGAAGIGFTPGGGGQSGSLLSGGSGSGLSDISFAGGGGGGTLVNSYEYPEESGIIFSGEGGDGSSGTSAATRKGGNGGEAQYLSGAPYSDYPITGYIIGQDSVNTQALNFSSYTYGGPGGVVGGSASGAACTKPYLDGDGIEIPESSDFYQYGTSGFSYQNGNQFMDAHGSCAYSDGGANGFATTPAGIGSGGGGGAGTDDSISFAGLGSAGRNGAIWLRYVQNTSVETAPDAPGTPSVMAGNGLAYLNWAGSTVGTEPIAYTVTSEPTGAACSVVDLTATCTGLTNGVGYTFKITATNTVGFADSPFSSSVTPSAPSAGPKLNLTPANQFVTFKPNGGTGTDLIVGRNSPAQLSSNYFKNPGSVFTGWNTMADGTGVAYADGATFAFNSSLTLYAQWSIVGSKKYVATFAGNKANLKPAMKTTIARWVKTLPAKASIVCQGSTSGSRVTAFDKRLAKNRAKNACDYAVSIRKDVTYAITTNPSSASKLAARHVWLIQK